MKQTQITIRGHIATFDAAALEFVRPVLQHEVNEFITNKSGVQRTTMIESYAITGEDGRVHTSAGLVGRIRTRLKQVGYAVRVHDATNWGSLEKVDESLLDRDDLSPDDKRFLCGIRGKPRGQIVLRRSKDIAWHVALLASFLPRCNILLVAKNRRRATQLCRKIREYIDSNVTDLMNLPWKAGTQPYLHVSTASLYHVFSLENWHVTIFADVESALAKRSMESAGMLPTSHHARYCFVSPQRQLGPNEQLRMEAVCGDEIYACPVAERKRDLPRAVFLACPSSRSKRCSDGLTRKRSQIWHNAARNQLIATVARTIETQPITNLIRSGVLPRSTQPCNLVDYRPTASILVECTEHAKQLQRLLPNWQVADRYSVRPCIPSAGHREIATLTMAATWGIGTDIVIRADGGSGWPLVDDIPGNCARTSRCTIVDIDDNIDELSRRETESRRAAYRQLGWAVEDTNWHDIEQLNSKPKPDKTRTV